jgi:hypothetical protein
MECATGKEIEGSGSQYKPPAVKDSFPLYRNFSCSSLLSYRLLPTAHWKLHLGMGISKDESNKSCAIAFTIPR